MLVSAVSYGVAALLPPFGVISSAHLLDSIRLTPVGTHSHTVDSLGTSGAQTQPRVICSVVSSPVLFTSANAVLCSFVKSDNDLPVVGTIIDDIGAASTNITTTISVRDRQSAAFGGTIKKKRDADFGGPTGAGAAITLNAGKKFQKNTSNFVVFVTPIIKASASAGVDQVKKKFRLRE